MVPQQLFKYRSLKDDEQVTWARELIQEGKIFMPAPEKLNDPCEFKFSMDHNASEDEKYQCLVRAFLENGLSQAEAKRRAESNSISEISETQGRQCLIKEFSQHGIFSVSQLNDNTLMWSHYADNHRGICVCFDVEKLQQGKDGINCILEVKYSRTVPVVNPYKMEPKERFECFFATKYLDWEHEKEWRWVSPPRCTGERNINCNSITGVILGARIKPAMEEKVLSWVDDRETTHKIDLFKAEILPDQYNLKITPLR